MKAGGVQFVGREGKRFAFFAALATSLVFLGACSSSNNEKLAIEICAFYDSSETLLDLGQTSENLDAHSAAEETAQRIQADPNSSAHALRVAEAYSDYYWAVLRDLGSGRQFGNMSERWGEAYKSLDSACRPLA